MEIEYFESTGAGLPLAGFNCRRSPLTETLRDDNFVFITRLARGRPAMRRRADLVNWVRELGALFGVSDAAVSNAVAMSDLCIYAGRADLVRVGAASLVISSKWHEDAGLYAGDIAPATGLPLGDLVAAEAEMLDFLDWGCEFVTPVTFIRNCAAPERVVDLACSISLLYAVSRKYLEKCAGEVAALCLYMAYRLLGVAGDRPTARPGGLVCADFTISYDVSGVGDVYRALRGCRAKYFIKGDVPLPAGLII